MSTKLKYLLGITCGLTAIAAYCLIVIVAKTNAAQRATTIEHIGSLDVAYVLSPLELQSLGAVGEDFDVTSSGSVILKSQNDLLQITPSPNGTSFTRLNVKNLPTSFAVDQTDRLLTVAESYLGMLGEDGEASHAIPLPYSGARVARSVYDGMIYLFGGRIGDYRLYRFMEDGTFQILLQSDDPIVAVSDTRDAVYAATVTSIVRIEAGGPTLMFKAPPDAQPIVSLAASADEGFLFFSTPSRVYALADGLAVSIINNSGGVLRLRGDNLYTFDRKRDLLFLFRPASRLFIAERKQ